MQINSINKQVVVYLPEACFDWFFPMQHTKSLNKRNKKVLKMA